MSHVARRTAVAATTVAGLLATGVLTPPTATAAGDTFTQGTAITIPSSGSATPYPSNIEVSGLPKGVTDVNVTLTSFDHSLPDNVDVMLVGPGGQHVLLMSDSGGSADASGVNLTFDDQAATGLPDGSALSSGSFRPTNFGGFTTDVFPAAPDPATSVSSLAGFDGTDPNGTWRLFVRDDAASDTGDFSGGWSLRVTTVDIPAAPMIASPHTGGTDRDGDLIMTGPAPVGSTVQVFEGAAQVGSFAATTGTWAIALFDVADGTHRYTATATDQFLNVSPASTPVTVRVDTVHPRVSTFRPAKGADTVRPGANVRAWFSEAVRPRTVTKANVRLVKAGSATAIQARVTYDAASRKVTLNPQVRLAGDTRYRVVVRTRVRDLAGNPLDQKSRSGNQQMAWSFTTR